MRHNEKARCKDWNDNVWQWQVSTCRQMERDMGRKGKAMIPVSSMNIGSLMPVGGEGGTQTSCLQWVWRGNLIHIPCGKRKNDTGADDPWLCEPRLVSSRVGRLVSVRDSAKLCGQRLSTLLSCSLIPKCMLSHTKLYFCSGYHCSVLLLHILIFSSPLLV